MEEDNEENENRPELVASDEAPLKQLTSPSLKKRKR